MSAPVLTKEQVQARRAIADAEGSDGYVVLADSHEALRAERDAALAVLRAISEQPCKQSYLHEPRPCARGIECAPCHAMKALSTKEPEHA